MAMTFTFATLENSARNIVLQVVGVDAGATTAGAYDGSSLSLLAANISGYTPTIHGKLRRVLYNTTGCMARLQWHQTSNAELLSLSGYGDWNTMSFFQGSQGMTNPNGAGSTGDIDLFSSATNTVATGTGLTAAMSLILYIAKGI